MLDLPDAGDRHVLAAAIKAKAQVIVTENLKHFPPDKLAAWNIEAQGADDIVLGLVELHQQEIRTGAADGGRLGESAQLHG